MAVTILTKNPADLLAAIRKEFRDGNIETWTEDRDGDFTHVPKQWKWKAWFRPSVDDGSLVFYILGPSEAKMTTVDYAVYHGRFIEMLLSHFDAKISEVRASAFPLRGDRLGGTRSARATARNE